MIGLGLGINQIRRGAGIPAEFILQMQTTTASETITLPMIGTVAVDIDWGDGTTETYTTDSPTHTFATAGTYDIKITGSCDAFSFNNGGDRLKLLAVLNGGTGFTAGSFFGGFYGCTNLVTADFKGLDTSSTTSMVNMFHTCTSLTALDVSGFNTANVANMVSMFRSCSSLTALDVSGFNTANVASMNTMFFGCTSLTALDVSGWNTANVANMASMLRSCSSLTSDPGIHAFNVTALTNAASMCLDSNNMLSTDEYNTILVNWEAQAVNNDVAAHFGNATYSSAARAALVTDHNWTITDGGPAAEFILQMETTTASESITLPMTGTVNVDIDWGDGTTETVTTASPSHEYATAGTHDIKVTGSCDAFSFNNGGDRLKLLAVLNGGTGFTAGALNGGFLGCSNLVTADLKGLNTSGITGVGIVAMFRECSSLETCDVSSFNTADITSTFRMFDGCNSLTTLDVSGWNTANVTSMALMFRDCFNLTADPGIHAFNVTSLTNAGQMCQGANAMLSTAEYNTILENWEAQAVLNDVAVHFGNATHSGAGSTARAALVLPVLDGGPGWTITDGGAAP